MNKKYVRGRKYEYSLLNEFRSYGYVGVRASGSHGFADLIFWRGNDLIFAQVKTTVKTKYNPVNDIKNLLSIDYPKNSSVWLVVYTDVGRGRRTQRTIYEYPK